VIDSPFTVLVDTREQTPYEFIGLLTDADQGFEPLNVLTTRRTLASGDYSIEGMDSEIAIERKSVADLFGTLGQGRARFVRELERLAKLQFAAVVVEGAWSEILVDPKQLQAAIDLVERFEVLIYANREAIEGPRIGEARTALDDYLDLVRKNLADLYGIPTRSQLNPKTIFRSVIAWQQRYPSVHWWFCPGRRFAEVTTYRILERFWKDNHHKGD
jgi:hypothetical protein